MSQRRFRLRSATWILALAFVPPMIIPAHADAPGNTGVQSQVDQLQRRVRELEQEVQTLKARKPAPAVTAPVQPRPPAPTMPDPATRTPTDTHHDPGPTLTPNVKENWRSIKEGMSGDQVRALLGEPGRRFRLNGQAVWYYHYTGSGSGSVMFNGDGRVSSWQHPPFGWLW